MKVGEWLKLYREQHNLSMQALADLCGFSKAYINVLEKGVNPKTGKPISPTMQTFEKIARGTKTDVDTLLKILDGDQPIMVNAPISGDLPDVSPTGKKIDARTRRQLEKVLEDDNLTYNGVVLNEEDREKVKKALELAFWDIKELNKRKKD